MPYCGVPLYNQIKRTIGLKVADKGSLDDESNGEHFNFIVECVNKQLKSNLSWAPSHLLWLSACRTYDFALTLTKNMNRWFKFIRLYIIFHFFFSVKEGKERYLKKRLATATT